MILKSNELQRRIIKDVSREAIEEWDEGHKVAM